MNRRTGGRDFDTRESWSSVASDVTWCVGWRRHVRPAVGHPHINGAIPGDIGPAGLRANVQGHVGDPDLRSPGLGPDVRGPDLGPDVRSPNLGPGVRSPGLGSGVRNPDLDPGIRRKADFEAAVLASAVETPVGTHIPHATSVAG